MKKWYYWFILTLVFAIGGAINYFDGKSILGAVVQVSVTVFLAVVQLLCDRKGECGKRIFRRIAIVVLLLIVAWLVFLVFSMK